MTNKSLTVGLIAVAIIAVGGYFFPSVQGAFAGNGTRFPNGVSADSTSPNAGQVRGTTLTVTGASTFGGTGTFTTTSAATSTVVAGCYQTYATSTQTPGYYAPTTATISTTTFAGSKTGVFVAFIFGSCPV